MVQAVVDGNVESPNETYDMGYSLNLNESEFQWREGWFRPTVHRKSAIDNFQIASSP